MFDWVAAGPVKHSYWCCNEFFLTNQESLNAVASTKHLLEQFCELEQIPETNKLTKEEAQSENQCILTTKRKEDELFINQMLYKDDGKCWCPAKS